MSSAKASEDNTVAQSFRQRVLHVVSEIPHGKVLAYGDIAVMAGNPRAPRQVGGILRSLTIDEDKIPWWRVVNKKGYLSINQGGGIEKELQKSHLISEGVEVSDDFTVDMKRYRWLSVN